MVGWSGLSLISDCVGSGAQRCRNIVAEVRRRPVGCHAITIIPTTVATGMRSPWILPPTLLLAQPRDCRLSCGVRRLVKAWAGERSRDWQGFRPRARRRGGRGRRCGFGIGGVRGAVRSAGGGPI